MRKLCSIALIGLLYSSSLFAQIDTLFYDFYWSHTSREKALYYRLKPLQENDGYRIKDFYISGALQKSAFSLSDSEDIFDGEVIWYYESGQVMQRTQYEKGIKEGTELQYDNKGNLIAEGIYKDNSPFRGFFIEKEDGYQYKIHYKDGERFAWKVTDLSGNTRSRAEVKLIKENDHQHMEVNFYGPKGDFIGHGVFDSKQKEFEGGFVQFMSDPMNVLSIKYFSNGHNDTTRYFYQNGQQKSLRFRSGDNLETAVYFDQSGNIVDTLNLKSDEPYDGGFLEFLNRGRRFDNPLTFKSYRKGQLHGPYTLFYNNGQAWEKGQYVDGEKDGEVQFWYKDESYCCSGNYKSWKKEDGEFLLKYAIGIELYENGKLKELRYFYPDGELQQYSLTDSLDIFYDLEGEEIARLTYKNQNPFDGEYLEFRLLTRELSNKKYYENGKLTKTEYFSSDQRVSTVQHFKADGNFQQKTEYYPSGEKMIHTQYGESYNRALTYYDKKGNILGQFSDGRKKNGEKYDFRYGKIWKITHYEDDNIVYEKEFNHYGQVLYEIDYNGKAYFYNHWGELIGECTYVNGDPYNGTYYTFDNEHIESIRSVKQGKADGREVHYKWNNRTRQNDLVSEGYYVDGKEEGIFKEYRKGFLLKSVTYKNGLLEGEAVFYNGFGNELSRAQYKEGYPFEGTLYIYTKYQPYLHASIQYHNGKKDGKEIYYDHQGKFKKLITHENGDLVKKVIYKNDTTYELIFRNSIPYEGVKIEGIRKMYYQSGNLVKEVAFKDYRHEQINYEINYDFSYDKSVETIYYSNGQKKSIISYVGNTKDGEASFYDIDGEQLGVGHYKKGEPISGILVYPHRQQENQYLLVELSKQSVKAFIFHDGKKELSNQMQLDTSFSTETQQEKVLKFLDMLSYGYRSDFSMRSY